MARRRRHRLLRGVGWTLLGLVALVLAVVIGLLAVLNTDWGRERVRRIAETQLNDLIDGKATVGRITGSPLTHFQVAGLTVEDPEGRRVISVGTFGLDWDPFALISQRFHARRIDITGPVVVAAPNPDGTTNLAHLLKPKTGPDTGPSPWQIMVDKLVVRDGFVSVPLGAGDEHMTLVALDVEAGAQIGPSTRALTLTRLSGDWLERGLPVDARGRVVSSARLDVVCAFEAHAGGSRVSVPFAIFDPGSGALAAVVDGAVREAELFQVWPHTMALGDATLGGAIARTDSHAPLEARLHAAALHGQLWAKLAADLDGRAVKGDLRVRGVRAPRPTEAHGDLDASFRLKGTTLETAQGNVTLTARGEVSGRRVDRMKVDAVIGGGVARADGTISAAGAQGQVHADVQLGAPLTLTGARLRAQVADLAAVVPNAKGSATADVTVSGTLAALAARGHAHADGVVVGSARVANADVDFDLQRRGADLAGGARLDAFGVSAGSNAFGRVRAEARLGEGRSATVKLAVGGKGVPYAAAVSGKVTLDEAATRIDFGELALSSRGLALNGRGGTIILEKSGAVRAEHVSLASTAGSVDLTGRLAAPRPDSGRFARDGELHLHVSGLDLARVREAFAPNLAAAAGKISLDMHAVRDGTRLGLEGEFSAHDVVVSSRIPPIDAIGRVNVGKGRLVANGHVRERIAGGVLDFAVESEVPARILDGRAWRDLDLDAALRGATVHLRQLDVAMLGELAHLRGYKGRIDGTVLAKPGVRGIDLTIRGRGLETPAVRQAGFEVRGTWDHQALAVDADLSLADQKLLTAHSRIPIGLQALLRGGVDVRATPVTVHVESHGLDLDKLRPALQRKIRLSGRADLDADIAGTVANPTAKARLALGESQIARVAFHSLEANASLDADRAAVKITATQAQGGSLSGDATIDRHNANAATAEVRAKAFDLAFLPALARGTSDALAGVGGKLDAEIHVGVTRAGRTATGQIALRDGSFYVPTSGLIDKVQLTARLDTGRFTVDKLEGRAGSGSVSGTAQANLDGLVPRDFAASIKLNKLPALAGSMVVTVSSAGELKGRIKNGTIDATATLRGTNIRVPPNNRPGGTLQSAGPLKDVVYVDEPDFMQRTAFVAVGGDPDVAKGGGMNMTIKLVTPGGVEVSGQEVQMTLNPNLTVYMRNGLTTIGGGVETSHGMVELFGRRWDVNTANLTFEEEDTTLNPRLDIELEHEFTSTTVYIAVNGTLLAPKLSLRAEPGSYEEAQILSWVLGGSPDEPTNNAPLSQRAAGAASSVLLGQIQKQMRSVLPFDVLSVNVGEGSQSQTTRVEVGKWLTDALFVGYRARVNAQETQNTNEADVEWRLGRRWLIDAFFGDRSIGSADVLWSTKY